MFVIERNSSFWLCESSIEVFQARAVSLRIQGDIKDFKVFQQRLDNFECLNVGVIKVYKCSDANKCSNCTKYKGCEILKAVVETAQAHSDFAKFVEANNGYTF